MPQNYKKKNQYIFKSPTPLEMLKNSFSLNWRKQNCSRMPYKRSSRIPRHFVSPKFWLFYAKREFFNTNRRLLQCRRCQVRFFHTSASTQRGAPFRSSRRFCHTNQGSLVISSGQNLGPTHASLRSQLRS